MIRLSGSAPSLNFGCGESALQKNTGPCSATAKTSILCLESVSAENFSPVKFSIRRYSRNAPSPQSFSLNRRPKPERPVRRKGNLHFFPGLQAVCGAVAIDAVFPFELLTVTVVFEIGGNAPQQISCGARPPQQAVCGRLWE